MKAIKKKSTETQTIVHTLKLSGEQIPEPPLQQWSDAPHEEQPDPPAGSPEPTTWTFAHRTLSEKKTLEHKKTQVKHKQVGRWLRKEYSYSVEAVVDEMLEIFAHSDLSHQLVLVAVHSR